MVALCCIATAVKAQDLPPIEGKSLSDREVVWPADARGRTSVLVMGLSKKCSTASRAWLDRLEIEYGRDKRVVIYLVPFLDQVPRLFRGLAVRDIRKNAATVELDTTVPAFDHSEAWKRIVSFDRPEDAYVLVVDSRGKLGSVAHGDVKSGYRSIQEAIEGCLHQVAFGMTVPHPEVADYADSYTHLSQIALCFCLYSGRS